MENAHIVWQAEAYRKGLLKKITMKRYLNLINQDSYKMSLFILLFSKVYSVRMLFDALGFCVAYEMLLPPSISVSVTDKYTLFTIAK